MDIVKTPYIQDMFSEYKINISDSGFAHVGSEWDCNCVHSPFSRIYYVVGGEAVISFKGGEKVLKPGNVYLIPLGMQYRNRCRGRFDHLYFHVNIDSPNGYDLLRGAICVGADIPVHKIEHLAQLYMSGSLADRMELRYEICRSLYRLIACQPRLTADECTLSPDISKAVDYIRDNLSIQLCNEEIAQSIYMSKNTLAKKFRREVGIPIGKYIDKLIFFEAEKMLTKTNVSLKEISDSLGFCDQFYFSRRFQQLFEESPLAYRKRTKNSAT